MHRKGRVRQRPPRLEGQGLRGAECVCAWAGPRLEGQGSAEVPRPLGRPHPLERGLRHEEVVNGKHAGDCIVLLRFLPLLQTQGRRVDKSVVEVGGVERRAAAAARGDGGGALGQRLARLLKPER